MDVDEGAASVFVPERIDEETRMIRDMTREFLENEVMSRLDDIDAQKPGLMESLLDKAGELGLLGLSVPEEYGGFGRDFNTGTVVTEVVGEGHSFPVALLAHTGIGTLPLLYYGTKAQKEKYLPGLASGALKAAYCLTEPTAGSDALSIRTRADLSDDGKYYVLNGQKVFITNAGFADLFTVFAKVDGEHFTAFLVERGWEGISFGPEEKKMGIKGSSTRQVFFENCKVPVENVLGEIGKGHHIAFNILNIGRFKLAAACVGAAKRAHRLAVGYVKERKQFGKRLIDFGAIRHKVAEQALRLFLSESATYRVSGWINDMEHYLAAQSDDETQALLGAAREYAVESAVLKVAASEMLDYVVDQTVQMYGGYGYIEEYPAARAFRDARINRIFEGTNEINRLLSINMLVRAVMKGKLDLIGPATAVQKELMQVPPMGQAWDPASLDEEKHLIANLKKAFLMVAGTAVQSKGEALRDEQELVMALANMMIAIFEAESALIRTLALADEAGEHYRIAVKIKAREAADQVAAAGKYVLPALAGGDTLRMLRLGLKRFTRYSDYNAIEGRRRIAQLIDERGDYIFE